MASDWILPITLLPAVGLFIMSTTALSSATSSELNLLIFSRNCMQPDIIRQKIKQLRKLSIALFGLYMGASSFAVAGLLGGLSNQNYLDNMIGIVNILLFIGVFFVVAALSMLVSYAMSAVKIKQQQFLNELNQASHNIREQVGHNTFSHK